MAVLATLEKGVKLVEVEVSLENTGDTAADISSTVNVGELSYIVGIVGYVREDTNNSGVTVTKAGTNSITVTAQSVPAGATTTVKVVLIGY